MAEDLGGDRRQVVPLVFKTSVGAERPPGGFDSHSPPPSCDRQPVLQREVS